MTKCYQIEVTRVFGRELAAIHSYITDSLKNPAAADKLIDELYAKVYNLSDSPFLYPVSQNEKLADRHLRVMPHKNYLVFYAVDELKMRVIVYHVVYGRRDLARLFW